VDYIAVETIDGREVLINKQAIVTIGGARGSAEQQLLSDKVRCLVTLVDGKFVTVVESCEAIRERLKER
jgi:uncharacterized protein YlzI (FlbEa/FlbD family)